MKQIVIMEQRLVQMVVMEQELVVIPVPIMVVVVVAAERVVLQLVNMVRQGHAQIVMVIQNIFANLVLQ